MIAGILIFYNWQITKIKTETQITQTKIFLRATEREPVINYREIEILTTAYSAIESCHYEGCLMANGERAYVGVIACNFLPFETKVEIEGVIYVVKDRHSMLLEDRLDIFYGYDIIDYKRAIQYGKQIKKVKIYKLD